MRVKSSCTFIFTLPMPRSTSSSARSAPTPPPEHSKTTPRLLIAPAPGEPAERGDFWWDFSKGRFRSNRTLAQLATIYNKNPKAKETTWPLLLEAAISDSAKCELTVGEATRMLQAAVPGKFKKLVPPSFLSYYLSKSPGIGRPTANEKEDRWVLLGIPNSIDRKRSKTTKAGPSRSVDWNVEPSHEANFLQLPAATNTRTSEVKDLPSSQTQACHVPTGTDTLGIPTSMSLSQNSNLSQPDLLFTQYMLSSAGFSSGLPLSPQEPAPCPSSAIAQPSSTSYPIDNPWLNAQVDYYLRPPPAFPAVLQPLSLAEPLRYPPSSSASSSRSAGLGPTFEPVGCLLTPIHIVRGRHTIDYGRSANHFTPPPPVAVQTILPPSLYDDFTTQSPSPTLVEQSPPNHVFWRRAAPSVEQTSSHLLPCSQPWQSRVIHSPLPSPEVTYPLQPQALNEDYPDPVSEYLTFDTPSDLYEPDNDPLAPSWAGNSFPHQNNSHLCSTSDATPLLNAHI